VSSTDNCDVCHFFLNNDFVYLTDQSAIYYRRCSAAHENTGERSSQYAAENSCRARYGPYAEWMATFDTGMLKLHKYHANFAPTMPQPTTISVKTNI
jgi:hypothetical protein